MLAYILISFDPGKEREAYEVISKMPHVKQINIIYGEWDIIVLAESTSSGELDEFVVDQIRMVPGVKLTSTMIVAK
jgi:DNA-binding Lrp family transcriptional regulator